MKAQDLMVSDWMIVDNEAMQVMPTLIDALFYDDPIKVEPIEITPEILEANGFTRYSVVHFNLQQWVLNEGNGCRVSLYQDVKSGKWAIKDFWIDYIHEMQHALRLIGHDDLADNFKIS